MWASFSSENCCVLLVCVGEARARASFDCVGMPVTRSLSEIGFELLVVSARASLF